MPETRSEIIRIDMIHSPNSRYADPYSCTMRVKSPSLTHWDDHRQSNKYYKGIIIINKKPKLEHILKMPCKQIGFRDSQILRAEYKRHMCLHVFQV